jgi:anti-anti-sigma factor
VAVSQNADGVVIRVKGEARPDCAGVLLADLLAPLALHPEVVTLDLSQLRSISSLAVDVLLAYRRRLDRAGVRVRLLTKLQPAVNEALARAGLLDLVEAIPETGGVPDCQNCPVLTKERCLLAVMRFRGASLLPS